jgi:hypothetical protein
MSGEASSAVPELHPRQRHARAATIAGTVRTASQRSDTDAPAPQADARGLVDGRPPAKRARKPINCEPCRASKLKCDRNRPCSSCVLRGASSARHQIVPGCDPRAERRRPSQPAPLCVRPVFAPPMLISPLQARRQCATRTARHLTRATDSVATPISAFPLLLQTLLGTALTPRAHTGGSG